VTVELRPEAPDRTELTLVHEGLADEDAAAKHRSGWSDIVAKLEGEVARKA